MDTALALNSKHQRKFPRYNTDVVCRFRLAGTFQWGSGELMNLSKGGVCLKAKVPPNKDELVEMEIDLFTDEGEWKNRKMRARVMWRKGKRAGLSFTND
ncbi:hypothetical protein BH10BDE1_BH10BDE1_10040 [soil metagenome]